MGQIEIPDEWFEEYEWPKLKQEYWPVFYAYVIQMLDGKTVTHCQKVEVGSRVVIEYIAI
jgi:hypothetical protein